MYILKKKRLINSNIKPRWKIELNAEISPQSSPRQEEETHIQTGPFTAKKFLLEKLGREYSMWLLESPFFKKFSREKVPISRVIAGNRVLLTQG